MRSVKRRVIVRVHEDGADGARFDVELVLLEGGDGRWSITGNGASTLGAARAGAILRAAVDAAGATVNEANAANVWAQSADGFAVTLILATGGYVRPLSALGDLACWNEASVRARRLYPLLRKDGGRKARRMRFGRTDSYDRSHFWQLVKGKRCPLVSEREFWCLALRCYVRGGRVDGAPYAVAPERVIANAARGTGLTTEAIESGALGVRCGAWNEPDVRETGCEDDDCRSSYPAIHTAPTAREVLERARNAVSTEQLAEAHAALLEVPPRPRGKEGSAEWFASLETPERRAYHARQAAALEAIDRHELAPDFLREVERTHGFGRRALEKARRAILHDARQA